MEIGPPATNQSLRSGSSLRQKATGEAGANWNKVNSSPQNPPRIRTFN